MPDSTLEHRSIFLHAWDLADAGVDPLMRWAAESGLNTLCAAGTYHSGWFVHPSHSRHRAYMTEGGVCYFRPDVSLYKDTRLRPVVSKFCDERDWLAEAGRRLDAFGLRLVSWTVGVHNTRLGLANPDLTQQNVYGDRLPHALCISNDDVRAYLMAISRDLAVNYPLWALQLEAFGWMNHAHGHHHERELVGLTALEQQLLSLCFCPACTRRAAVAGVDCPQAAIVVRGVLDAAFREAPSREEGHPTAMADLERSASSLAAFNVWRREFAQSVIAEVRKSALCGTSCRVLLQTPYDDQLRHAVAGFACWAYGQTPEKAAKTCRLARQPISPDWHGLLQCFVQLGQGVPESEGQLRQIVDAVRSNGCNGINFYNRSESPPKMLGWLAAALR